LILARKGTLTPRNYPRSKCIELAPKKPTIEVGGTESLIPTLETIIEAVIAGERDKQLAAAKQRRKRQKI